ncbi:nuclear transport factor 2 family protein [Novosphingobium sp. BL-52-GroH]|uniref:nuclear transport factor 2 family protein n=1 Tax=Novosphingobium sp. BL-52-GroH TaxID=3349877 RepID=UPI00384ACA91
MSDVETLDLEQAIRDTYRLWNEGKREELDALFARMGPAGFSIEYVGSPAVDGPAAMEAMWREYGGKCSTEAVEVIANGTEGAAYVANHLQTEQGVTILPSLETYRIADGKLTVRYYHRTKH